MDQHKDKLFSFHYRYLLRPVLLLLLIGWGSMPGLQARPAKGTQQETIIFKVQVSSRVGTKANLNEFDKYNFEYPVEEYFHKNRYKYLVGKFYSYAEAKGYRNQLMAQGLKDAFIVAVSNKQIIEDW